METPTEYTPAPQASPAPSAEGAKVWVAVNIDGSIYGYSTKPTWDGHDDKQCFRDTNHTGEIRFEPSSFPTLAPGQCVAMVLVGAEEYRSKTLAIENFKRTLRESLLATAEQRERANAATARAEAGEKVEHLARAMTASTPVYTDSDGNHRCFYCKETQFPVARHSDDCLWASLRDAVHPAPIALTPHPTAAGEAKASVLVTRESNGRWAIWPVGTTLTFRKGLWMAAGGAWAVSESSHWHTLFREHSKIGELDGITLDALKALSPPNLAHGAGPIEVSVFPAPPSAPQPAAPFAVGDRVDADIFENGCIICVRGVIELLSTSLYGPFATVRRGQETWNVHVAAIRHADADAGEGEKA